MEKTVFQLSLLIRQAIESTFANGAEFILLRFPRGQNILVSKDGRIGNTNNEILTLLHDLNPGDQKMIIWTEYLRDCNNSPDYELVFHAYGPKKHSAKESFGI